jgi:hypothetical protein
MNDQGRYGHACHGRTGAARRHLQLTLPACGLPVRLARQVTREVLTAWQLAHVEETAVLLVSELVTNSKSCTPGCGSRRTDAGPGWSCRAPRVSSTSRASDWPW